MKHESLGNNMNPFIAIINEKVPCKFGSLFKYFRHKKKVKKFRKNILQCSPTIGLLWKMADFIKLAEKIFFYDNSLKNSSIGLYSSRSYTIGQNGFRVNTQECRITIKLINSESRVMVEIERLKGDGGKSTLSFINGEWEDTYTKYDEMLLEQIIKIITVKIIELFDLCYSEYLYQ